MPAQLSILKLLQERLDAQGVDVDARKVGAVILETAREAGWPSDPAALLPWLSQLAMEVTQTSPNVRQADWPAADRAFRNVKLKVLPEK